MFTENIKSSLEKLILPYKNPRIILGLSGGPDSTALFHILKELEKAGQIKLIAAHLNHGWREEAIDDEKFCRSLCEKHKILLEVEDADEAGMIFKLNGSKEELGRNLRRHFFKKLLKKHNAQFIALAHHLQDQQETFFLRMIRGTTLSGLTCMKEKDGIYIRPFLNNSKKEILEFLHQNNFDYIQDASNDSNKHLRNRIRKELITAIEKCDDRFNKKFKDTLLQLQKEDLFLEKLTEESFNKVFSKENPQTGCLKIFLNLDSVLQHRLLIFWLCKENVEFKASSSFLNELMKFLTSPRGGTHDLHLTWKITKKSNRFWIEK